MTNKLNRSFFAIAFFTSSLLAGNVLAADKYQMDPGHTEVMFGWSHAGVSVQHGEFKKTTGILALDPENVENSNISVSIDTSSVSTGYDPLDDHLKTADFLNVEKYPEMTFKSTSVKKTGEKTADIDGDLTLHGVTKPVTLKATLTHIGEHPLGKFVEYYKGNWVAFTASAEIDHQAFGVGSYSTGPISVSITTEMNDKQ